ncbi:MAG: nucleoside hydrolase [Phycisphaerae bacterium]|nr:nucleoside hydrolase [Phycisphaerae bacterium]
MRYRLNIALIVLVVALPVVAHDVEDTPTIIIDTDMGIDDAVAMALALQCPRVRIASVVACEGVAGNDAGVRMLGQMLDEFNRGDIALYAPAPATADKPAPPFRGFAEQTLGRSLRGAVRPALPFAPEAYVARREAKTIVLAIGPLTNLAIALEDDTVRDGVAKIVVQGTPDVTKNWNLGYDPAAFDAVRRSGVPLQFVESGPAAAKPSAWDDGDAPAGQRTSIGEAFVGRLFRDFAFADHYTQGVFADFTDELVLIAYLDHDLFEVVAGGSDDGAILRPKDRDGILSLFTAILSEGRQAKNRVVFAGGELPDTILQPDVRRRKAGILAKNGETEWFAQLLMNELHEHLGSYSIIGVKMGLRAAELLNAPPHGMQVVSHSAPQPPVSCINDGIIVSTGSTPGRTLFRHEPGPPGSTRVSFSYNGRQITLAVKDEYRKKVQANIDKLLEHHSLEDAEYWDGVRRASLEIWEHWHRRDLFDVIESNPAP